MPKHNPQTNVDQIASSAPKINVPNIEPYPYLILKQPIVHPELPIFKMYVLTVILPIVIDVAVTNTVPNVQDH